MNIIQAEAQNTDYKMQKEFMQLMEPLFGFKGTYRAKEMRRKGIRFGREQDGVRSFVYVGSKMAARYTQVADVIGRRPERCAGNDDVFRRKCRNWFKNYEPGDHINTKREHRGLKVSRFVIFKR